MVWLLVMLIMPVKQMLFKVASGRRGATDPALARHLLEDPQIPTSGACTSQPAQSRSQTSGNAGSRPPVAIYPIFLVG